MLFGETEFEQYRLEFSMLRGEEFSELAAAHVVIDAAGGIEPPGRRRNWRLYYRKVLLPRASTS